MRKPITVLSILVVAALTFGSAVAEHLEKRAQQDRFYFDDAKRITSSSAGSFDEAR